MKPNTSQGVIANKEPRQQWLQRFSLGVQFSRRRRSSMLRLKQSLTGEAGALAALNRLYAQNDAGMQRLADR
jgi:hypothetical protein